MMNNNNLPSLVPPRLEQINSETGTLVKESNPAVSLANAVVYSVDRDGSVVVHPVGRRTASMRAFAMDYRSRQ